MRECVLHCVWFKVGSDVNTILPLFDVRADTSLLAHIHYYALQIILGTSFDQATQCINVTAILKLYKQVDDVCGEN